MPSRSIHRARYASTFSLVSGRHASQSDIVGIRLILTLEYGAHPRWHQGHSDGPPWPILLLATGTDIDCARQTGRVDYTRGQRQGLGSGSKALLLLLLVVRDGERPSRFIGVWHTEADKPLLVK
jgi:hypothetical protein